MNSSKRNMSQYSFLSVQLLSKLDVRVVTIPQELMCQQQANDLFFF